VAVLLARLRVLLLRVYSYGCLTYSSHNYELGWLYYIQTEGGSPNIGLPDDEFRGKLTELSVIATLETVAKNHRVLVDIRNELDQLMPRILHSPRVCTIPLHIVVSIGVLQTAEYLVIVEVHIEYPVLTIGPFAQVHERNIRAQDQYIPSLNFNFLAI